MDGVLLSYDLRGEGREWVKDYLQAEFGFVAAIRTTDAPNEIMQLPDTTLVYSSLNHSMSPEQGINHFHAAVSKYKETHLKPISVGAVIAVPLHPDHYKFHSNVRKSLTDNLRQFKINIR